MMPKGTNASSELQFLRGGNLIGGGIRPETAATATTAATAAAEATATATVKLGTVCPQKVWLLQSSLYCGRGL
jgi:hypothetical protein